MNGTSLVFAAADRKHRPASHPVYGGTRKPSEADPRLPLLALGELRFMRERRGLTQRNLADAIGVTRVAVSSWERGHCQPSLEHYAALVRVLRP